MSWMSFEDPLLLAFPLVIGSLICFRQIDCVASMCVELLEREMCCDEGLAWPMAKGLSCLEMVYLKRLEIVFLSQLSYCLKMFKRTESGVELLSISLTTFLIARWKHCSF